MIRRRDGVGDMSEATPGASHVAAVDAVSFPLHQSSGFCIDLLVGWLQAIGEH